MCLAGKVLLLCLLLASVVLGAPGDEKITVDYSFERPEITQVTLAGEVYDRVIMEDAPNSANIGQPALPASGARILIPYGREVASISVVPGDPVFLGSGYYVEPMAEPIPLMKMSQAKPPVPDLAIYDSDQVFPLESFESIGVQIFRGYSFLTVKLNPVKYRPLSGELYYYPDLQVNVLTVASNTEAEFYRGFDVDQQEILKRIDNPEMLSSYAAANKNGSKAYDLLIITTSALQSAFVPLKDYHDTTGILTEIHTTDDIGSNDADDIRDYIRDRYLADGVTNVIIGGDDDVIPAKDLYVLSYSGGPAEYNMPSDIFLGCLDGPYNSDGDGNWGEPTDGAGGGDVDLVAEVYIGRASVGNTTEADRFVDKTLWYLTRQHSQPEKVLMVGEYLGFGYPADYAGDMMDEIVDGTDAHGYTTVGIPSDVYDVDRLYERDWANWPQSEIINRINAGIHIINHLGHGSENQAMKLYNGDITGDLNNTDLCFVYSQTCLAGHFDGTDCWAETMNIKTDHGGWGIVMNARYGWGAYNTTDGPSQRFDREFWDAVFSTSEGMPEVGRANQDSKEDNLYRINESCMRWITYELNLFGDPTVAFQGVTGIRFTYPNGIPEYVVPGQESTFEVAVTGTGDGVPVPGTGELHYSVSGGAYQTVPMTEIVPNEYEATLPMVNCEDILEFYLSADEQTHGTQYDGLTNPYSAIPATQIDTVYADDFETNLGWTMESEWEIGTATAGGGDYGNPDPGTAVSGSGVLGYDIGGDYSNSMPQYDATSSAIDCSGLAGVRLSFWRWLNVEQPTYDHAYLRISTNGTSWTTIWENGSTITDNAWTKHEFDVSAYADDQATVYIRFTMGSTDGGWTYSGWNVDDLLVIGMACDEDRPIIATPSVPDWTQDLAYSQLLTATGGTGVYTWSDRDDDLVGTGLSLAADGQLSGIPTTAGPISFTARVEDDALEFDEQLFNFTINEVILITTTALPDWTADYAFSQQLDATGGTGSLTWTDQGGDLSGTGLTISAEGLVAGTPVAGPVAFSAVAADAIGADDDQAYAFTVNPALNITTTEVPDGINEVYYEITLTSSGGTGTVTWSDLNGDLAATGLTLDGSGVLSGTPAYIGEVSFTANIVDQIGASDQQLFTFTLEERLHITTTNIGDWTMDHPMSWQIDAGGVQGTAVWSDLGGDLAGTGLTLSSGGLLSGTPSSVGEIIFTAFVADDGPVTDQREFTFDISPVVVITTEILPEWTVGVPYEQQLAATGGTRAISWSDAGGDLDGTGLSLSIGGTLEGTATASGDLVFTAHAQDKVGAYDEKVLTVTMNPAPTITTETLPDGAEGYDYDQTLTATGGTGALVFSDKNGSLVGTGLSLGSDGHITGIPTASGTVNFTALVTDDVGGSDEKVFTIEISPALYVVTEDLPDWTVNAPYLQQLEASTGVGELTWSDKNGDLVGTGLALSSTGELSGTPVNVGLIVFTAAVSDEATGYDEKELSFYINAAIEITTASLPEWTVACAYSQTVECTGGTGAISFSDLNSDLVGTGLGVSTGGLLSGTPITVGLISFTLGATDEGGGNASQPLSITINEAVAIVTTTLPDGIDGQAYEQTLTAEYGTAPYVWADKNGDLAATGLLLSEGGVLSGTVTGVQTIEFTAEVSDLCGSLDEQSLSLYFGPAWLCGDIDNSGVGPDVADLVYLVSYMFQGGPEPDFMDACDMNGDGIGPDVADLVHMVSYMFQDGPDLNCEGAPAAAIAPGGKMEK